MSCVRAPPIRIQGVYTETREESFYKIDKTKKYKSYPSVVEAMNHPAVKDREAWQLYSPLASVHSTADIVVPFRLLPSSLFFFYLFFFFVLPSSTSSAF